MYLSFRSPFQYPEKADNTRKVHHCLSQLSEIILYFCGGITNEPAGSSLVIKIHSKGQYPGVTCQELIKMVINQIQQEIIGSDFFKVWVMSFHCAVPLVEFKGTAETVFLHCRRTVLPARQIQFVTVSHVASPGGIVVIYTINVKIHARMAVQARSGETEMV